MVKEWLHSEYATFYVEFLEGLRESYYVQLANNFLDEKDRDVSHIIRGRIFELNDLLMLPDQMNNVQSLEQELKLLESEGFTADREPKTGQAVPRTN